MSDNTTNGHDGRSRATSDAVNEAIPDWAQAFQPAAMPTSNMFTNDGQPSAGPHPATSTESFRIDPFVMESLQSTASAILAAQEQAPQEGFLTSPPINPAVSSSASASAMSGSESDVSKSRTVSPSSRKPAKGESSALQRTHSQGKDHDGQGKAGHHDRHMWSAEETQALVKGCNKHGVGNWKAILSDAELTDSFKGRTPGDLKDRFRTYFPDAYHDLYPNAKTHTSRAVRSKAADGSSIFEKGKTKERRPFSAAEDEVLKKGYEKHGSHWAIIAREPVFEGRRKSTDLRDRFRNAFPGIYEQAGFKPRAKVVRREHRTSSSGSFSQIERPTITHASHSEDAHPQRPRLDTRRETSTSTLSQDRSEISEDDESAYQSDAIDASSAIASRDESSSSLTASQQSSAPASRSQSFSTAGAIAEFGQGPLITSPDRQPATASSGASRQPLRRSHSSKRGAANICSLEQTMKNANTKSNREAILATHQHGTHQHHHHHHPHMPASATLRVAQAAAQGEDKRSEIAADDVNTTQDGNWTVPSSWGKPAEGLTSASDLVAAMDLDQINDLMTAPGMMDGMGSNAGQPASQSLAQPEAAIDGITAAQNAMLDNILQQWSNSSEQLMSGRPMGNDTFQALLDPLGPSNMVMQEQNSASMWTPISSSVAPAISAASPTTASRRDHEHNQWAGDLLHRGNFDALMFDPHAFISLMNGQTPGVADAPLSDNALRNGPTSQGLHDSRPPLGEHSISMPDFGTVGTTSNGAMNSGNVNATASQKAAMPVGSRDQFAYPADDLSLLNSAFSTDSGLYQSASAAPAGDVSGYPMKRRRSTDTLRENSEIAGMQPWRNITDGTLFSDVEEASIAQSIAEGSISAQSGDHSRSLSSLGANDDDDIPSRAASVGNLDFANLARDQSLYAESLPDLSSASFADGASASVSNATFGQLPQLQMSYDDMDLPSFLNRSPAFANLSSTGAISTSVDGSPRLAHSNDGAWRSFAPRQQLAPRTQSYIGPGYGGAGQGEASETAPPSNGGFQRAMSDIDTVSDGQDWTARNFAASRMNDAGALDRLEHLYLEGLHTPASPLMSNLYATQQQQQQHNLASSDLQSLSHEQQRSTSTQRPSGRASVAFGRFDTIRPSDNQAGDRSS